MILEYNIRHNDYLLYRNNIILLIKTLKFKNSNNYLKFSFGY